MHPVLTTWDDRLVDKAGRLAAFVEARSGMTHWRLAGEALTFSGVAAMAAPVAAMLDGGDAGIAFLVAAIWLIPLYGASRRLQAERASAIGGSTARMRERPFRIIAIAMLIVGLFLIDGLSTALYLASLAVFVLHSYLKSCDPPPPTRRPMGRRAHA